jgi:dolichol-phosphate mannosyltransferase
MDKSKIVFIIPSYNESQNLVNLISKIKKSFKNSYIVVVDDSTGSEKNKTLKALRTFEKDKKFNLISRKTKSGRGSAVMDGLKYALLNKNIKYFFELDADLSHNPQEAVLFLNKMKASKSDLVIGSRYMKKSEIKKWARWRIIMSKNINIFLKYLLNLKLTDYTNGFRLYTRDAVIFLSKRKFRSDGFILLSETAFYLKKNGYKISEVPISFTEREKGKSSMGNRELLNSLYNILIIRFIDK